MKQMMKQFAAIFAAVLLVFGAVNADTTRVPIVGSIFNGGTIGDPLLVSSGSVTAPSVGFSADADGSGTGIFRSAANQMSFTMNGAESYRLAATTFSILNNSALFRMGAAADVILARDAAGVLGVRNGTNAQSVRVYLTDSATDDYVTVSGQTISSARTPTVSACGVSPSVVTGSNLAGKLTTGSGGTTQSCTITFVPAFTTAPACTCTNETNILLVRGTTTTTTLVCDAAVAGTMESDVVSYVCLGGS